MKKKVLIVLVILSFLSVSPIFAGPFGIGMGMSLDRLKQICKTAPEHLEDDYYEITPPNTSALFDIYVVRVDPAYGVYLIRAISEDIYTNDYGTALRAAFDNLVESIERNYGEYEKTDSVDENIFLNEPQYFMRTLEEGARELYAVWADEYQSRLPDDIVAIVAEARANTTSAGYLRLSYYLSNGDDVRKKADEVF